MCLLKIRVPIGQAYGLTETCAGGTFSEEDDTSVGRVGAPLPCSFVKVMTYLCTALRKLSSFLNILVMFFSSYNALYSYFPSGFEIILSLCVSVFVCVPLSLYISILSI